jgi:hypothetical protein
MINKCVQVHIFHTHHTCTCQYSTLHCIHCTIHTTYAMKNVLKYSLSLMALLPKFANQNEIFESNLTWYITICVNKNIFDDYIQTNLLWRSKSSTMCSQNLSYSNDLSFKACATDHLLSSKCPSRKKLFPLLGLRKYAYGVWSPTFVGQAKEGQSIAKGTAFHMFCIIQCTICNQIS